MEIELNTLVENIFSKSPQSQNSIQLEFINELNNKDLFEFLLSFFTEGAKFKYGVLENNIVRVNLNEWSERQLMIMKEYFASISFILNVEIFNCNDSLHIDFQKLNYKKMNITHNMHLRELKLPLNISDKVYVISFDYLYK